MLFACEALATGAEAVRGGGAAVAETSAASPVVVASLLLALCAAAPPDAATLLPRALELLVRVFARVERGARCVP